MRSYRLLQGMLASLIAALGKGGLNDIAGDLADDHPLRDAQTCPCAKWLRLI